MDIESTLLRLANSKFRASFHLKKADIEYIKEKGWECIQTHCHDFISKRLAPAEIAIDGKHTPTHGHPVFIAQHACACCCRGCLSKWHKIKNGISISNDKVNEIVELLMAWIHKEFENYKETTIPPKKKEVKPQKPIQLKLF
jgi:exodeoxyribonuclease V alpha subunit